VGFRIIVDQADKPNSVEDDHLSGTLIAQSLERHSLPKRYHKGTSIFLTRSTVKKNWSGTTLHAGKDLFVASSSFDEILPEGNRGLSALTSLWSPLSSRTTGVTRYLFPISNQQVRLLGKDRSMFGLSSRCVITDLSSDRLA
jgi:hypothetical protein